VVGLTVAMASVALVGVAPASASTLGGSATPSPTSGGSTTGFQLLPPSGAVCTGSSNTGTYVFTYLVRPDQYSSSSLGPLTINSSGLPTNGLGLFNGSGYIGSINTDAPPSGQTSGAVDGSLIYANGNAQFSRLLGSTTLATLLYSGPTPGAAGSSGVWEAGLLCADSTGAVTDFWNTEVTFTYSATDHNHFTWTSVAGLGSWVPEASIAIALPLIGLAVLVGGLWLVRRRRAGRGATNELVTIEH